MLNVSISASREDLHVSIVSIIILLCLHNHLSVLNDVICLDDNLTQLLNTNPPYYEDLLVLVK